MLSESLQQAQVGPSLAKLALALVSFLLFMFLRGKETEGVLTRYALFSVLLFLRDLAFLIFPSADLYRVTDLLVYAALAWIAVAPRGGWALRIATIAVAAAAILITLKAVLGLVQGFPAEILRYIALVPILVAALDRTPFEGETAPGWKTVAKMRSIMAGASLVYLVLGSVLGVASFWFQGIVIPLCYCCLILLAFIYMTIVESDLVSAVNYYEESVDSLYELLLPTEEGKTGVLAMEEALESMVRVVAERTGAEGAAIFLVEEFDEALSVRAIHGAFAPPCKLPDSLPRAEDRVQSYLKHVRLKLGEGLVGEVTQTGKPLFIPDALLDSRVPRNGDEDWLVIASLMACPLVVRDRIIGVITLERRAGEPFTESDFDRAKLLASFGSIAIANIFSFLEAAERSDIEREATLAEGIQKTLVPKKLPPIGEFTFGALTRTAQGVCSDYYDVIQTRADRAVLAVGDIAGKGIAAGIVMVMVSSILHLITNSTKDTATLMSWVNRGVTGHVDLDHFATLGLVTVDFSTGLLEFSNASHQPLLIYRKDSDAVETVDQKSIPIGVERTTGYSAKGIRLHSGDILLMHTDGLVEAMNEQGRQFGRKNLANTLVRCKDLPAAELAEAILGEVQDFAGRTRQHDDETVLVMKAKL